MSREGLFVGGVLVAAFLVAVASAQPKAPNTLLDLQYQFNSVNNITQLIDGAGTHNYSYDTVDRLIAHPN